MSGGNAGPIDFGDVRGSSGVVAMSEHRGEVSGWVYFCGSGRWGDERTKPLIFPHHRKPIKKVFQGTASLIARNNAYTGFSTVIYLHQKYWLLQLQELRYVPAHITRRPEKTAL